MRFLIICLFAVLLHGCGDYSISVDADEGNVNELKHILKEVNDCESIGKRGAIRLWSTVGFTGSREYSLSSSVVCKSKKKEG